MSLAEQFQAAVTGAFIERGASFDFLPMVFVQAVVEVLPVDGAGLSLTDQLRVPLAASHQHVVMAERLQTTLGEGPCLTAVAMAKPVVADLAVMAARWPRYHERFVAETPYLSLAALPLPSAQGSCLGAIDLYSTSPATLTSTELEAIDAEVATPIAHMLCRAAAAGATDETTLPSWMCGEQANDRLNVWVAIGMSMALLNLSNKDALALLRGYAHSHNLSLDQAARLMTDRGLEPKELLGER